MVRSAAVIVLLSLSCVQSPEGARVNRQNVKETGVSDSPDGPVRPSVAEAFQGEGTVQMTILGMKLPWMPMRHTFSLATGRQRMDSLGHGGRVDKTEIERHDERPPMKYEIDFTSGEPKCSKSPLEKPLTPMSPPPFARFCGDSQVDDEVVRSWCFDIGFSGGESGTSAGIKWKGQIDVIEKENDFHVKQHSTTVALGVSGGFGGFGGFGFSQQKATDNFFPGFPGMGGGDLNMSMSTTSTLKYTKITPGEPEDYVFELDPAWKCTKYAVSGYLSDAVTGAKLSGVSVLLGKDGADEFTATTDENGQYTVNGVVAGTYQITVNKVGYIDHVVDLVVSTRDILAGTFGDIAMSPVMPKTDMRIVLTWAADPSDLDASLTTPTCGVSFEKKVCTTGELRVSLDRDARYGYGPETITIKNVAKSSGKLEHWIHIFDGNGGYAASNAKVDLFSGDSMLDSLRVPSAAPGPKWWHTWSIESDGSFHVVNEVVS